MNYSKLFITLALGCFLGACGKLEGTLKVNDAFEVYQKKGAITVVEGAYDAKVSVSGSSTKMSIKGGPQKISTSFKLPKLEQFKNLWRNDELNLKGDQIGQPFNVKIVLTNEVTDGGTTRGTESCVYDTREIREYICRDERVVSGSREVCKEKDGRQVCHTEYEYRNERVCGYETRTITIYGERNYEGYTSYEKRGGTVTLSQGGGVVARMFDKGASRSGFNRTYTGSCQR